MPIKTFDGGWVLETRLTGYAFGLDTFGLLAHYYWGPRLPTTDDYRLAYTPRVNLTDQNATRDTDEEYPVHGGLRFGEPCLVATFCDNVCDLKLQFEDSHVRQGPTPELDIVLRDTYYPLNLTLHYRLYEDLDLIERWVSVTNEGSDAILLQRIWSAQWHLPPGDPYRMSHFGKRWADEMHLHRDWLTSGVKTIESKRGITSHAHNPWFAIDDGTAGEDQGNVWFGALAWSGNWKLAAEVTDLNLTRLSLGINDWDSVWQLKGGETFVSPVSFAGYTPDGFGAASRTLHDLIREHLLPHGRVQHKVLYNSWEATLFNVDEVSQGELAVLAAQMGVELFVMDDGWFHGRNSDTAGLGDWWPDEVKFRNGLSPLIEKVNALGMDFGLWIEPEAVNPDSELYRTHPEWVLHYATRTPSQWRNQLTLNLAREDVQAYLIEKFDRLLSENRIAFIKWDMNRDISEPGWPDYPGDRREVWVRYVQGLYRVWGELRKRHPEVIFQSCAGGAGRADLGILRFADQIWTSDNTEASARLRIQNGFSYIFPANVMEAWVTDAGADHIPLEFRFHVSMCGVLGVGGNLLKWDKYERDVAARLIAQYKAIRPIVQFGDQYRLIYLAEDGFFAVQYMSKDRDEGVLFVFRTHQPEPAHLPLVYLRGLDPQAQYNLEYFDAPRSGAAWMYAGCKIELKDWMSVMLRIQRTA